MSGIFGLVNLDGAPVDPEDIEAMRAAMAHGDPAGIRTWTNGEAALGQCVFFDTPEAVHEHLRAVVDPSDIVFTAEARIDNRQEVCALLGIPSPDGPTLPDGDVVAAAYRA